MVVGVDAGHDRGRRRRRPRRRRDRLRVADTARGQLVDRPRVHVPGAVAAEMVGPQCVGDVDDDVHSAADCSDGSQEAPTIRGHVTCAHAISTPRSTASTRLSARPGLPGLEPPADVAAIATITEDVAPYVLPAELQTLLGARRRRPHRGLHLPDAPRTRECLRSSLHVRASDARSPLGLPPLLSDRLREPLLLRDRAREASGAKAGRSSNGTSTRSRSSLTALADRIDVLAELVSQGRFERGDGYVSIDHRAEQEKRLATPRRVRPSPRVRRAARDPARARVVADPLARRERDRPPRPRAPRRDAHDRRARRRSRRRPGHGPDPRRGDPSRRERRRRAGRRRRRHEGPRRLVPGRHEPLGSCPPTPLRVRGHGRRPGRTPCPTSTRSTLRSPARSARGHLADGSGARRSAFSSTLDPDIGRRPSRATSARSTESSESSTRSVPAA